MVVVRFVRTLLCAHPKAINFSSLVHLDSPIDGFCEPETREESHGTTEKSEANGNHAHVGQVDNDWQEANQIQSARQEPQTVQEQVDTGHGAVPEGLPPPTMIFGTKLQIAQDDTDLGTSGSQNTQDSQQESHDVIDLVQPQGGHDKGQFNADRSKGQDTSHNHGQERVHVPGVFGNDTGNLVGLGGGINEIRLESEKGSNKDQGS
jgi:hypothetical protein